MIRRPCWASWPSHSGLSPEALAKQLGPILKKMLAGQAVASGSKPRRKPKKESAKPAAKPKPKPKTTSKPKKEVAKPAASPSRSQRRRANRRRKPQSRRLSPSRSQRRKPRNRQPNRSPSRRKQAKQKRLRNRMPESNLRGLRDLEGFLHRVSADAPDVIVSTLTSPRARRHLQPDKGLPAQG